MTKSKKSIIERRKIAWIRLQNNIDSCIKDRVDTDKTDHSVFLRCEVRIQVPESEVQKQRHGIMRDYFTLESAEIKSGTLEEKEGKRFIDNQEIAAVIAARMAEQQPQKVTVHGINNIISSSPMLPKSKKSRRKKSKEVK